MAQVSTRDSYMKQIDFYCEESDQAQDWSLLTYVCNCFVPTDYKGEKWLAAEWDTAQGTQKRSCQRHCKVMGCKECCAKS